MDVESLSFLPFQFTHPGRGATMTTENSLLLLRFQFTHPGRGATVHKHLISIGDTVSIHAPREGCDSKV